MSKRGDGDYEIHWTTESELKSEESNNPAMHVSTTIQVEYSQSDIIINDF